MAVFTAAFEAEHLELLAELPGTEAALQRLRAAGLPLAVVSNKQGSIVRREAAHLGWEALFNRLVGAGDAARDKPAVEPVQLALQDSGVAPGPMSG